jgi:hypothetical protein
VTSEFRDVSVEADPAEASCDPRSERRAVRFLPTDGIAQDLPNFFLRAAPMTPCSALKLLLYVLLEMPHQDLSHV